MGLKTLLRETVGEARAEEISIEINNACRRIRGLRDDAYGRLALLYHAMAPEVQAQFVALLQAEAQRIEVALAFGGALPTVGELIDALDNFGRAVVAELKVRAAALLAAQTMIARLPAENAAVINATSPAAEAAAIAATTPEVATS